MMFYVTICNSSGGRWRTNTLLLTWVNLEIPSKNVCFSAFVCLVFSSDLFSPPFWLLISLPLPVSFSLASFLCHSLARSPPGSWACIYGEHGSNWTAVHSPIRELGCWGLNLGQQKQQFSTFSLPVLCLPLFTGIYLTSLRRFYFSLNSHCSFPLVSGSLCVWPGGVMLIATATKTPLSSSRVLGLFERWPLALCLSVCHLPLF